MLVVGTVNLDGKILTKMCFWALNDKVQWMY